MKLNEVLNTEAEAFAKGFQYLADHPEYYSTSRDVLSMLSGWAKNINPEVERNIEKILAATKEKDRKVYGGL